MKMVHSLTMVVLLSGCATLTSRYTPQRVHISEPPLNSTNTVQIGDSLLRQGSYTEHEAIIVPAETRVSWAYTVRSGTYLKEGENDSADFYLPTSREGAGVIISPLADPVRGIMAYREKPTLCVITVFSAASCGDGATFDRRRVPVTTADSFQQTLIYNGRVGNKLRIGYREFSNTLARPAFNNEVEYDLDESSLIGYRGARIEVIEAGNQYITYKLLQNFTPAVR